MSGHGNHAAEEVTERVVAALRGAGLEVVDVDVRDSALTFKADKDGPAVRLSLSVPLDPAEAIYPGAIMGAGGGVGEVLRNYRPTVFAPAVIDYSEAAAKALAGDPAAAGGWGGGPYSGSTIRIDWSKVTVKGSWVFSGRSGSAGYGGWEPVATGNDLGLDER